MHPSSVRSAHLLLPALGLLLAEPRGAAATVTGRVTDAVTGSPIPCRLYLERDNGTPLSPLIADPQGSAVRYERRNWVNPGAQEVHSTLSAHPWRAELEPGTYRVIVERGKEYRPLVREFRVGDEPVQLELPLQRWIRMDALRWYGGDTHVHRSLAELPNLLLAEDLNVALPLTYWTTRAGEAPAAGDKTRQEDASAPAQLIRVDDTHVIWPRNTEYEIFSVGGTNHTLGALFLLNHRTAFTRGVPPWSPVAAQARDEGALLDMDKLDWPFAFMLPPVTGATLYELANNHMWRTAFGFTQWVSAAPPYLQPPYGGRSGNERDWTLYTHGMYHTLLNAGFRVVPTAGTASGVHPVPLGFSRVYVHLPQGFSYEAWIDGLARGRSFVTTGPMLLATVNDRQPGEEFAQPAEPRTYRVAGRVVSEHPLAFLEVLHNGIPVRTLMPRNSPTPEGAHETAFSTELTLAESGWLAVRCWEDRPAGRFRWAHSAPWHVTVPGKPLQPRREEKEFLVGRMEAELARSRSLLAPEALAEYDRALARYRSLEPRDDTAEVAREARAPGDDASLRRWLQNMVWFHRSSPAEMRAATGLGEADIRRALDRFGISEGTRPARKPGSPLTVLPYPGGRHPRAGFLEGAIHPQRDTKFSVFTPWDDRSYVVADIPEAIWSNLGLTYLAHEHIPTVWTAQGRQLEPLEWREEAGGALVMERRLPNGLEFGTRVLPAPDAVRMECWIRNGTTEPLTGLRFQNCVMLKAAAGFHAQTGANKVLRSPYAACRSDDGRRWIITAWEPIDAPWQNPPVPCIHANARFPDCPPGATVRARGWLSFHEGEDLDAELDRIERTGWRAEGSVRVTGSPAPR